MTNDHLTGFVFGVGAAAAGLYLYKKNRSQVDAFLREQGIQPPDLFLESVDYSEMSLEELTLEKEKLEDLIARHHAGS